MHTSAINAKLVIQELLVSKIICVFFLRGLNASVLNSN